MKKLRSELNAGQCDFLKSALEGRGIRCVVKTEPGSVEAGTAYPLAAGPALPMPRSELWVKRDEDFDRAMKIVNETDLP